MEEVPENIFVKLPTSKKKVTLIKWRVKEGTLVNSTVVVLLYQEDGEKDRKSFRTNHVGVVKKILIHEGQEVPAGYLYTNKLLLENIFNIRIYLIFLFYVFQRSCICVGTWMQPQYCSQ